MYFSPLNYKVPNAVKIGRLTFRGGRGGGGWCGCLSGGDEPPEITYCVADGGGGALTLQSLTPTQPMPDQEELNAKFAELVVSTHVKYAAAGLGASLQECFVSVPSPGPFRRDEGML